VEDSGEPPAASGSNGPGMLARPWRTVAIPIGVLVDLDDHPSISKAAFFRSYHGCGSISAQVDVGGTGGNLAAHAKIGSSASRVHLDVAQVRHSPSRRSSRMDEGAMATDLEERVRIYVGGLTPNVTSELLARRFEPFGEVSAVHVAPPSAHGMWRGFGFVTLRPHSEKELRRCLLAYHHCKWMGGTMRVQKAKPDFRERLRHEWEEERRAQDQEDAGEEVGTTSKTASKGRFQNLVVAGRRPGQLVDTTEAVGLRRRRVHFRDVEPRPADWECPPRPPDLRVSKQRKAWKSLVDAGLAANGLRDVSSTDSEDDEGAVLNFVSDDEEDEGRRHHDQAQAQDLARFDSESDEEIETKARQPRKEPNVASPSRREVIQRFTVGPSDSDGPASGSEECSERSVSSIEEYIQAIHKCNPAGDEMSPVHQGRNSVESSLGEDDASASLDSKDVKHVADLEAVDRSKTDGSEQQIGVNVAEEQPLVPHARESQARIYGLDRFNDSSSAEEGRAGAKSSSPSEEEASSASMEGTENEELARALEEEREKQRSLLKRIYPKEESRVLHAPKEASVFQPVGRFDPTKFTAKELMEKFRVPQPARPTARGKNKIRTPLPEGKPVQEKGKAPTDPVLPLSAAPAWDAYQKSSWTDLVGSSGAVAWSFSAPTKQWTPVPHNEEGTEKDPPIETKTDPSDGAHDPPSAIQPPQEVCPSPASEDRTPPPAALPRGHTFVRTQDKEVLESAWESQRGALLEDFKRKRRAALRALPKRRPRRL